MFGKNGKVFVFAADQRLEHLEEDFVGEGISEEAGDPEHLFRIAAAGKVDLLATHLGLIIRHGDRWKGLKYLAKLNGRTNVVPMEVDDPRSGLLWTVQDVVEVVRGCGLKIPAVGYTIFLGSRYEQLMLQEAAQVVMDGHREGLKVFLWIYAKGMTVKKPTDVAMIAGAAGVGHLLGADFVKVYAPEASSVEDSGRLLGRAVRAAGNTGVICAGGKRVNVELLVRNVWHQVKNGAAGVAVGRNIFQRSLADATKICHAIRSVVHGNASIEEAIALCR